MATKKALPVKTGRFIIRKLTSVVGSIDLHHALHRHDYYFILAVEKGAGLHTIDFQEYRVKDRSVFLLRPGQVHELTLKAGSTGYLAEFDTAFYQPSKSIGEQRWKKAIAKNHCRLTAREFTPILSRLHNLFTEYEAKQDGYAEAIHADLDLFLISWLRKVAVETPAASTADYSRERFEELTHLLETRIHEEKSAAGYAKLLSLSLYQLNSITKSVAGKTASDLINEQILLEAKRHLLGTSAQIKDIAFDLGYEDVSYFVRFFKKHTGATPDTFRKNFR
ncbi:MAG: helix-turn-helix transcriptional regulator [Bacteroidota bacterium]